MTVSNRLDSAKGLVSTDGATGTSVAKGANYGFAPYKVDEVMAQTTSMTCSVNDAGVITLSGSAALEVRLPLASTAPGAWFTFRNLAAQAHVLTSSLEAAGATVINAALVGGAAGAKLTMSGAISASVTLFCDGATFQVVSFRTGSVNTTPAFTIS